MNKLNQIIRVGIYIRVSTEEQAKHGYSIESQRTRLIEWSKEHNYQIIDVYADEGKSARTKISNRKELNRLLEDVQHNRIDRIIIWRLDRWFRNVADYYRIQDILDKYNVDWECSDEDFNTSTSNGRLYLNIKLSIAQNESDQTSDRIKFNFENMVRNKRPISGALPVGYKIEGEKQNKRVVKDEALSQMAIDMFDKFEETLSLTATTKYLYENYPQRPIRYERVKRMLKNTMYYGMYRGVEDYCPAYVSKERFDKVQNILKKNQRINKRSTHVFIFSGLIKCYGCNFRMTGCNSYRKHANGEKIYYGTYKCCNHFLDCRCENNHTIMEYILEDWLVKNFLVKAYEYATDIKSGSEENEAYTNKKKIEDLESKLDRINDLYIDGRISREKYELDYNSVKNKILELNDKPVIETKNIDKYINLYNNKNLFELYNQLNNESKRLFWNEYIDRIEQNPENPTRDFVIFFK